MIGKECRMRMMRKDSSFYFGRFVHKNGLYGLSGLLQILERGEKPVAEEDESSKFRRRVVGAQNE